MLKREIRLIGIDDAPFNKFKKGDVLIVGTIFRGGSFLDGILSTRVTIDGDDSTDRLVRMINSSKFKSQIRCIILDGIALGGFNIIDIESLNTLTGVPVIVVVRREPNISKIISTLTKLGKLDKIRLIEKAGKPEKINKVYIQIRGTDLETASEIMRMTCTRSNIPEPVRIAHIIASGIVRGESKGRA